MKNLNPGRFSGAALCLLLLSGTLAVAQTPLGRIAGVVRDPSGAVVAGATITVTNEATGQTAVTTTTDLGAFVAAQLSPGSYTVRIEGAGFALALYKQVKVDPGQEYSLNASLKVGGPAEVVEVTAGADLVNTTTSEINNTVSQNQILQLPLNGRNPIELIRTQAGVVGISNRTTTAINGGRPTWTQVTQDGINIQDNFIRTNSLDFVPNRPTVDTVGEFTITTNAEGADAAGGSSQIKLITPSGTNAYHGSVFEYNRNSALAANEWFNNNSTPKVPKRFLNRNQFGARVGGPVIKKLFFYGYYEGFRQVTQAQPNEVIPAHDDYLTGAFRYVRPSDQTLQTVNVISAGTPLAIDPKVKSLILDKIAPASKVNNFQVGNSKANLLLNTAGFRFNQGRTTTRNYFGFHTDYDISPRHHVDFAFSRLTDVDDRPDLDAIHLRPQIFTEATTKQLVGAWRWTVTLRLQNELRMGANLAPVAFNSSVAYPGLLFNTGTVPGTPAEGAATAVLSGLAVHSPIVPFQPQGRDTRTRQYMDNASWIAGNHSFQFGGGLQQILVNPFNFRGRFPVIDTGFSAAAPPSIALTAANFPNSSISAADLNAANVLRAFLSGTISRVTQVFQVKSQSSGFVAGVPNNRNYTLNDYSFYFQDSWRLRSNLVLKLGLKWEYFSPLREDNGLALLPVVGKGADISSVLLDSSGAATVDFANSRFYGKDLKDFGPSVGFAWDPFRNGKTSIRGGYTLAYVNEETFRVAGNAVEGNPGLASTAALVRQFTTVNAGVPTVPTPAFKVPRTYADQIAINPTNVVWGIDPKLRQPYVHEFSFSVQRELPWEMAVESRYVGTLGRRLWQGRDLNQTNAGINSLFLADFLRARSNGFLALAATGTFNPAFNAAVPGSQRLTFFPTLASGGLLTNATVRSRIQTGQPAALADFYVTNRATFPTAPGIFLPNPAIYASDLVLNGAETDYHGWQTELRRRFKNGVFAQVNYTFSKVLTNSSGTAQTRFEPFLDNARPQLEKSRAEFDVTHVINGNVTYELPFGRGKRFAVSNGVLDRAVGGWQISSVLHWQGGSPFSILAVRGTFNRAGRSLLQTAVSNLTPGQIRNLFGIVKTPDGKVFYISPSVVDPVRGIGVGPDTLNNTPSTAFNQVFFNPTPGNVGNLQRQQFDGPAVLSLDLGLAKRTRITERVDTEFRADFFNFPNHPSFQTGDPGSFDWDVNRSTFGQLNGVAVAARVLQLGLRINF